MMCNICSQSIDQPEIKQAGDIFLISIPLVCR